MEEHAPLLRLGWRTEIMTPDSDTIRSAAVDAAAAPLDLLRCQVAKECPEDPQEWLRRAETCHGSWWPDYADWLAERCGEERAAPGELGGGLVPIGDAPGTYVYDH
jgi:hypothetical protein